MYTILYSVTLYSTACTYTCTCTCTCTCIDGCARCDIPKVHISYVYWVWHWAELINGTILTLVRDVTNIHLYGCEELTPVWGVTLSRMNESTRQKYTCTGCEELVLVQGVTNLHLCDIEKNEWLAQYKLTPVQAGVWHWAELVNGTI